MRVNQYRRELVTNPWNEKKQQKTSKRPAAKTKVKDLANNFDLAPKIVIEELQKLGVKAETPGDVVADDILDVVKHHLDEFSKAEKEKAAAAARAVGGEEKELHLKSPVLVKSLAEAMGKKPNEIISKLLKLNVLASINQTVDVKIAEKVCVDLGFKLVVDRREKDGHLKHATKEEAAVSPEDHKIEDKPEDLQERPPVVTFLGHVDHGKTSIQDAIRKTDVARREAGGITQHMGASEVTFNGKTITFIDTPGHEAFTAMRARGANVTDIAVLVVAADDGFMPQTVEALSHAKAAAVPIVVAINKMDLPSANPEKVYLNMQQNSLLSEEWGGNVGTVKISATKGTGIEDLLNRLLLEAEVLELKANPKRRAEGVVLEAELEQGMGATSSVLVRNGTLKVGDIMLCGPYYGRVKALINSKGERIKTAGPSMPVKVLGLSGVPDAGSRFIVCENEREASQIAEDRSQVDREKGLTRAAEGAVRSLEDLFANNEKGKRNDLNIIIKTDVRGSAEAIVDSLGKLSSDKIKVNIVHTAVGAISEADVLLSAASSAIIIGFHVKVNPGVNTIAKKEGVEIRLYSIIYELLEDITEALEGRLAPERREKELGAAKIVKIFDMSKGPKVCGCLVDRGLMRVGAKARVRRSGDLIYNGSVQSLRRFQDDVKEVKSGLECGIRLDNFIDFQENDIIETYDIEFKKATL